MVSKLRSRDRNTSTPHETPVDVNVNCPDECSNELLVRVEELIPLLYNDLRHAARSQLYQYDGVATLTATALVHECYLRLGRETLFDSHAHFLRVASVAMRRILVDRVRARAALKRGGLATHEPIDEHCLSIESINDDDLVMAVHEALTRLAEFSPRLAQVVECRFFAGYDERQTAEALGITDRTVRRDWVLAKSWLEVELSGDRATPTLG